ncbi:HlyD family secretion protein [Halopseudomonas salegens]|uniref:Membrane fusion protein, multidrug efflux system n=1 Tax=Halopseudomonas salegens TaxID=1434072 RepID=A0A1H2FTW0_9GAMM|nr:HlyD family secretion protein [Halopseudomonas salegens]SDU10771.1 membrane fusion protein, multidrug efflux system [Halopseudomonas salegens]
MSTRVRFRLLAFFCVVLLALAGYGTYWWLIGQHYTSTNNAYVQADITRVSSQLHGQVSEIRVTDNQQVQRGDILLRLDPRDHELALRRAQARYASTEAASAQVRARLAQQDSLLAAARANVAAREAEQQRYQRDLQRLTPLLRSGYAAVEQESTLQANLAIARAQQQQAEAALATQSLAAASLEAELSQLAADRQAIASDIEQAQLNIERSDVRAAIDGVVGQRNVRPGQSVQPGQHLLALVPPDQQWIQANFKETQISRMRPGQTASLTLDAFPGEQIDGRIDSLFPAAGSQFSLLPADNASGNFTKVVQRIPVKILPDPTHPLSARMRPGMSVSVRVDLRDD